MKNRGLKKTARKLLPPVLFDAWHFGNAIATRTTSSNPCESPERSTEWYDRSFEDNGHWRRHYTASGYYFLWCVIIDRMQRAGAESVLDVGCGPGQFAALLRDRGIRDYRGVDFSTKRVAWARHVCPEFTFVVADVFQTDLFETFDHDTVVCNEFLEHIERDLDLLDRLHPGVRFYGTVPNFPYTSHVRHFDDTAQVAGRYAQYFNEFQVDAFLANASGRTFYLMEGIKA